MTSENSKPKSSRKQRHDAAARRADEHPLQLQPESGFSFLWFEGISDEQPPKPQPARGQSGDGYLAGPLENPVRSSSATVGDLSPLPRSGHPAELAAGEVLALYPSGFHPSEVNRPGLVEAVIEQLRQARLRRQRPH